MAEYTIYFRVQEHLIGVKTEFGEYLDDVISQHKALGWQPYFVALPVQNRIPTNALGNAPRLDGKPERPARPDECKYHPGNMRDDREGKGRYCHTKLPGGKRWCGFKVDNEGQIVSPSRLDQE